MQKKKEYRRPIFLQMLSVILVPLIAFVIMIMAFESKEITDSLQDEIKEKLKDDAEIALYLYDKDYPGGYSMDEASKIYKGGKSLEESRGFVDKLKEITGADITIYYKDIRVLTTLTDTDGSFITGTKANSVIKKSIMEDKQEMFYPKSTINGVAYFAYYAPIYASDGSVEGMVFAGRPAESVQTTTKKALIPIVIILIVYIIILVGIITVYSRHLSSIIVELKAFLNGVSGGNLEKPIKKKVYERHDELGDIAKSADSMRGSLKELIENDPLTGLYNRRYGIIHMKKLMAESQKYGSSFFVCLADIDFFKKFNDNYGHDCGDEVLKTVSSILKEHINRKGFVSRWGGEEFLMAFEADNMDQAFASMERLIKYIRESKMNYNGIEVKITISVGVTEGGYDEDIDVMVKRADDALYLGKEGGRDRVVIMEKYEEAD